MNDQRFFQIGLPQLPVNTDPRIELDLRDVYNAIRNLNYSLGQYCGFEVPESAYRNMAGAEYTSGLYKRRVFALALEAMTYGAMAHLTVGGGQLSVRNANATNFTRPCYGINNTLGVCAIGDMLEIVLPSCHVTSVGGMAIGQRYFLDTVNGGINLAAPAVPGNIRQAIGIALDTNVLFFHPNYDWTVV